MNTFFKALIAGSAALAMTGVAGADDIVSARITYNPDAPVTQTYAQFETTAKRACKIDVRRAGSVALKHRIERSCRAELVNNAVQATQMAALIAYHNEKTGISTQDRTYAAVF